jgi:nitrogenase iron protein NifH
VSETERIAVYGKGGIGKSVVATALSAVYAMAGKRVLHVGCDPKHDSAIRLLDGQPRIRTVLDVLGDDPEAAGTRDILNVGRHGIHCCESGGPPAGLGCGGRGVARTIEHLDEVGYLRRGEYDVAVFDVLGDVVCGGFAAPLRDGFARKVLIVLSEEPMALFAANNIARAVEVYRRNGVALAGLVVNRRSDDGDLAAVQGFGARLGTSILAVIHRDPRITEAEKRRLTIVEHAPDSDTAATLRALADRLIELQVSELPLPTPMSDEEFFEFIRAA